MQSLVQKGSNVHFPAFTGERIYMKEFRKGEDLGRWNQTVDEMLQGVKADGPIYLMVDQQKVVAGKTHRQPGAHVDGYWDVKCGHRSHRHVIQAHGHTPGGHQMPDRTPGHQTPTHLIGNEYKKEILILASDVVGCKAYVGGYEPTFGKGGDMSHLNLNKFDEVVMRANIAWVGDVWMLHESIPHETDCLRTVVRLNVTVH